MFEITFCESSCVPVQSVQLLQSLQSLQFVLLPPDERVEDDVQPILFDFFNVFYRRRLLMYIY